MARFHEARREAWASFQMDIFDEFRTQIAGEDPFLADRKSVEARSLLSWAQAEESLLDEHDILLIDVLRRPLPIWERC